MLDSFAIKWKQMQKSGSTYPPAINVEQLFVPENKKCKQLLPSISTACKSMDASATNTFTMADARYLHAKCNGVLRFVFSTAFGSAPCCNKIRVLLGSPP